MAAKSLALRRGFTIGKDGSHLKLIVGSGEGPGAGSSFSATGFRMGERLSHVQGAARVDLAFSPNSMCGTGRLTSSSILKT